MLAMGYGLLATGDWRLATGDWRLALLGERKKNAASESLVKDVF
jgi:hypothetical protein